MAALVCASAHAGETATGLKPCQPHELQVQRVSEDAAMGGVRRIDYAFIHPSAGACTLSGYPRFEVLRAATGPHRHRTAATAQKLATDRQPLTKVRLDPDHSALFSVHYNAGGAGYTGKPCPVFQAIRISPPGSREGWSLQEPLTLCRGLRVSAVR